MELKEDVTQDLTVLDRRAERELQASRLKEQIKAKVGAAATDDEALEKLMWDNLGEDSFDEMLGEELVDKLDRLGNFAGLDMLFNAFGRGTNRYYLKAMNCPHHHKLYDAIPRSYRDLPLRLAEYGTCHRYEQSGELFGLMRVRSLQMNDAHIYCTEDQFETEFLAVNEMYLKYFKLFGIEKYVMRFSTHDPAKLGQKFVDNSPLWLKTEEMVRGVLQRSGINYVEVPNEAAFYGPKIDVQVWSAIGREFTIATNQVDFAQPNSFGLVYKDRDNTEKTPLCIHRAPLGTHERFIGFLIEHYAGNFPLWLAPEQVRILPIGDEARASRIRPRNPNRTARPTSPLRTGRQQRPYEDEDRQRRADESPHHARHRQPRHGSQRGQRPGARKRQSRRKAAR